MKQGMASRSGPGAQKREPISHAMNPAGVAQMGRAMGGMRDDENITGRNSADSMNAGRGANAPAPAACTVHKAGSQGKHR